MLGTDNRKAAIKKIKLLAYNQKIDADVFRKRIDEAFYTPILPNHVERSEHSFGNVLCDVLSPELYSSKRVMFYIHGGSFVGGSRASYREFCSVLANRCFCRVVVPEYRLAPSHAYPAAIEDIQAVFRALFTEEQIARSLDSEEPEFIVAADGAGASIALALLYNLKERYRNCIKKVVLFSPWLNLGPDCSLFSTKKKYADEILSSDVLNQCANIYTYESNRTNPLVSACNVAKELLEGFPSVYIQCGGKEILLQEIKDFEALLKECNIDCKVDIWPKMMHLFQLADEYLTDAHDAFEKLQAVISGIDNTNIPEQVYDNKPFLENSLLRTEA